MVVSMGKVFVFIAIEICLLVTPMMWPTIPFEIGLVAYAVAALFAVLAAAMLLKDRIWDISTHTQLMRVQLPERRYATEMRDGRRYDRARLEISNPAPNLAVDDARVKLVTIADQQGIKTSVNKYLKFEDGGLDVASIATGSSRSLILFESECRLSKTAPKVEAPKVLFGPLRSRNRRYVEMPPGQYVATIRIEGSRVRPEYWDYEVILDQENKLTFRTLRRGYS
jgi:hypothetical protein